jgi:hypothetical protein
MFPLNNLQGASVSALMSADASAVAVVREERSASPWLSGVAIVWYVAMVRVVLYFLAGSRYGYFRDELYYLACGEHPAWGYVDQPPLIGWVAWVLEHTIGTSLWALRLLPMLSGVATVVLSGLLARELGGRRWAMFLAAVASLMAPVLLALSHLFTMNAFDPLLWTAIGFLLVRIARVGEERLWVLVGVLVGITILNKYAILFWVSGVIVGVCLTPLRRSLRERWFWIGCAIATAIAFPNFIWEWRNGFPFLELMHNVRESGRDILLGPLDYLGAQAQMLGFVAAVLVVFAVAYLFSERGRDVRVLGWAYLVFLAEMMLLKGKMYYVAPVYPMMFAAGAVWLEAATLQRVWVWAKPVLAVGIVAVSGIYLPTLLPILSVPAFLAYEQKMGVEQQRFEHTMPSVLPQLYADMFGWEEMAQQVAAYYRTLPPDEQRKMAIFGNNYGEAGAIDRFGPKYGLPKAIGGHQSYWLWGPREYTGESMIVLGEGHESNMQTKCTSYSIVGEVKHPLSRPDEWLPMYHCRGFKGNLRDVWPALKRWR